MKKGILAVAIAAIGLGIIISSNVFALDLPAAPPIEGGAVDFSSGFDTEPTEASGVPGTTPSPVANFSGLATPWIVNPLGPVEFPDYVILHGQTDVRMGLINRGAGAGIGTPLSIVGPASLPNSPQGTAYPTTTIVTAGGNGAKTFSWTGSTPPGLTINSATGVISGTPTIAASYTFTVQVADSTPGTPQVVTRAYTVVITRPDYVVQSVTLSPANPLVGDTVTFTGIVKNQGTQNAASTSRTAILVDGATIAGVNGQATSPLAASATSTHTQTWTATGGNHTIRFYADSQNVIAESNNNNNWTDVAFSVSSPLTFNAPTYSVPNSGTTSATVTLISPSSNTSSSVNTTQVRVSNDDDATQPAFNVTLTETSGTSGTFTGSFNLGFFGSAGTNTLGVNQCDTSNTVRAGFPTNSPTTYATGVASPTGGNGTLCITQDDSTTSGTTFTVGVNTLMQFSIKKGYGSPVNVTRFAINKSATANAIIDTQVTNCKLQRQTGASSWGDIAGPIAFSAGCNFLINGGTGVPVDTNGQVWRVIATIPCDSHLRTLDVTTAQADIITAVNVTKVLSPQQPLSPNPTRTMAACSAYVPSERAIGFSGRLVSGSPYAASLFGSDGSSLFGIPTAKAIIGGGLTDAALTADAVTVYDKLYVRDGDLYVANNLRAGPDADTTINVADNLTMNAGTVLQVLGTTSLNNLIVSGGETVINGLTVLSGATTLNTALTVNGAANFGGATNTFSGATTLNGPVTVNANATFTGTTTLSGPTNITNQFTANGIGKYYLLTNYSNAIGSITQNATCASSDILISCSGGFNAATTPFPSASYTGIGTFGGAFITGSNSYKTCTAVGRNTSTTDARLYAQAVCFNPDGGTVSGTTGTITNL